jgi:hypothetical protein
VLDGDRGAQEIGYCHDPDQGAIVVQHGETADFALAQQRPASASVVSPPTVVTSVRIMSLTSMVINCKGAS